MKIPDGLPHAGEYAMDAVAKSLFAEAWEAAREEQASTPTEHESPGSLAALLVALDPGDPCWGGSNDVMRKHIEPFMAQRGLPIGSGKRTPEENRACGGSATSDHLTTKTRTAARDFPTFDGEDAARALAASLGCTSWQPNSFESFSFSAGGHAWRAQILWGAGISHSDHVHVGVSRA